MGTGACASAAGGGNSTPSRLITREQIDAQPQLASAMDVVRRLRPNWLNPRNNGTFTAPAQLPYVFVDGVRFGALDSLNQVAAEQVQELRFQSAMDATTLYGTGYMGGIIHVTTR